MKINEGGPTTIIRTDQHGIIHGFDPGVGPWCGTPGLNAIDPPPQTDPNEWPWCPECKALVDGKPGKS